MARVPSRLGTRALLRNLNRCIYGESIVVRTATSLAGHDKGILAHEDFRAGSIRRATSNASLDNQRALVGSRNSYNTMSASGYRVAASNPQLLATLASTGDGNVLSGLKFEVPTRCDRASQTMRGWFGFNATRTQCTSIEQSGTLTPVKSASVDSGKVEARISNVPKFLFKSDLLWLLKGCNLSSEDLLYIYDLKYRLKFVQIRLPSVDSFQLVQRALASKGRFGGRYLKLTSEVFDIDGVNKALGRFRGRSLLMVKVPLDVNTEAVERFFSGFALDSNNPIKFVRLSVQIHTAGNPSPTGQVKTELEMRALVRFETELEGLRALREKQGAVLLEKPMQLRFIW